MSSKTKCLKCNNQIESDLFLTCLNCNQNVHLKCLDRSGTPGDLIGDVFFKYICKKCSPDNIENFSREKLPWLLVVILAVYNLTIQSNGLSYKGYFHWKTHIANFIVKNWNCLFNKSIKNNKWIGTISGILSRYSPNVFFSGHDDLNEQGWWKLTTNNPPSFYMKFLDESIKTKEKIKNDGPTFYNQAIISQNQEQVDDFKNVYNEFPYIEIKKEIQSSPITNTTNMQQTNEMDFSYDLNNVFENLEENMQSQRPCLPHIIQIINFQGNDNCTITADNNYLKTNIKLEKEDDDTDYKITPSYFTKLSKRPHPWLKSRPITNNKNSEKLMSQKEENEIFLSLNKIIKLEHQCNIEIPTTLRKLYRTLHVRKLTKNGNSCNPKINQISSKILDRFLQETANLKISLESTFNIRLIGFSDHELFESPYTSRILHSFIYRSSKFFPNWLKLLCEIKDFHNSDDIPTISTIDFCYVRPHHIAAVNGLLQQIFWPGVDISETLGYPDFSVVALYKKLVVGCAFLVPDVGYNEAYISFMAVAPGWNRVGIASFMLYHLVQTCMGKDITLHVSATNPAVCLYQKFGFKIEELVLDFYDKYFPINSRNSRHAFFLRLKR